MTEPQKIRIVLADDHAKIRQLMAEFLQLEAGFEIVAVAEDGPGAVAAAAEHQPDVVILDVSMPGLSGLEACRQILAARRETRVVFLSSHDHQDYADEALAAGGLGYVIKPHLPRDLAVAVRSVVGGTAFTSPGLHRG